MIAKATKAPTPRSGASRGLLALLVFTLVASVSLSVGARLVPLDVVDGTADGGEWFAAGENLARFGVLGSGERPWVHRPPGYPLWVAGLLRLAVDPRKYPEAAVYSRGPSALHAGDAFLLGVCSALLFLWLARRLRPLTAFLAALFLGANAYSLVMATLIHYDTLHWTFLIALLLGFDAAFRKIDALAPARFLAVGLLLGITTLVRPVTLLVPFALLPVFFWRDRSRRSALRYLTIMAGMALSIAPWTIRNFALTGRLIPINVQGWTAVFGSTAEVMAHDPDRYDWSRIASLHYMPIYREVTGERTYTFDAYASHVLALEDACRAAALHNLAAKPTVYVTNLVRQATGINRDVNALLLTLFTRLQTGEAFNGRWIYALDGMALSRGPEASVFQGLHDVLLSGALFGLGIALYRRDFFLAPAVALWAAIAAAHTLSYLDFYYYAVKLPFLAAFAFYGLDALPRAPRYGLLIGVSALSLALSWSMRLLN
jgi:hypothetical protein